MTDFDASCNYSYITESFIFPRATAWVEKDGSKEIKHPEGTRPKTLQVIFGGDLMLMTFRGVHYQTASQQFPIAMTERSATGKYRGSCLTFQQVTQVINQPSNQGLKYRGAAA